MKIKEILYEKKYDIPTSNKRITGLIPVSNKLSHLGSGIQSIAYMHNKKPNTVIKVIQVKGINDPALAFIRLSINHPDNPFFPKIYKAKMFNLKSMSEEERDILFQQIDPSDSAPEPGTNVVVIIMEELIPMQLPENELESIRILQQLNILPKDLSQMDSRPFVNVKRAFSTRANRKNLMLSSSNVEFKQAIRLLEPLFRRHINDLHQDNMMLRKTGEGMQLVIIDPIC